MDKKNKKSILEKLKEHHLVSDGIEYLLGIIIISLPLLATYFFKLLEKQL